MPRTTQYDNWPEYIKVTLVYPCGCIFTKKAHKKKLYDFIQKTKRKGIRRKWITYQFSAKKHSCKFKMKFPCKECR